jgi:hypothetical protein
MDIGGIRTALAVVAQGSPPEADAVLAEQVVALIKVRHLVDHVLSVWAGALDRRGVAKRLGAASTAALLMTGGLAPGCSHRMVRVGRGLVLLPRVAAHAADGDFSGEQVDAIVRGIAHVERAVPDLPSAARNACVNRLLGQAWSGATPAEIGERARGDACALAAATGGVPVSENAGLNGLTVTSAGSGRVRGRFDVDALLGEKLLTALSPLTRPMPADDGTADPRSTEQRMAEGLERLIDAYLQGEDRPTVGGVRPHLTMTVDARELAEEGAAPPGPGASTDEYTQFLKNRGYTSAFQLQWMGPITGEAARLLACDATLTSMILNGERVPLDVGREHRIVTPAIRKALMARDCGCAFPGCGRPAGWTDAHHIVHWSKGGKTSLSNTVLLCRHHHRKIHHQGWEVKIADDGHPWFTPPEHVDRQRRPLPAHRRSGTELPVAA